MLEIFVRENNGNLVKKRYVFRSSTMNVFSEDNLIRMMAESNTTVSEADIRAVFNVLKSSVLECVEQGYKVKTPLGLFYASAAGSTDDLQSDFDPHDSSTDHTLKLHFRPDRTVAAHVLDHTEVVRSSNIQRTMACIDAVRNAAGTADSPIRSGDVIHIDGTYLKFDPGQTSQGIFLTGGGRTYRMSYYTRVTSGSVECRITPGLPGGIYTLAIRTQPADRLIETTYREPVAVQV